MQLLWVSRIAHEGACKCCDSPCERLPPHSQAHMCRRDYDGLLDAIQSNKELMTSPLFLLRLIGRGELEIPEALQGKVLKETDMAYKV